MSTAEDTQPIVLDVGFLDFDAPDYKPVDVTTPKRTPESILRELMEALRDDRLR